jgi:preprotein translocase subunit SecA
MEISNMMLDVCENIVIQYHDALDYEGFNMELIRLFSMESPVSETEFRELSADDIMDRMRTLITETFRRKVDAIAKQAYPVIKDVYEKNAALYENIVVPISDGSKVFQVVTNLKKAYETQGRDIVKSYQKTAILMVIDELWKEHLREMDDLKQSVQTATYEQKDPLLIYKFESFELFKTMISRVNSNIVATLMKGHIPIRDASQVREAEQRRRLDMSRYETSRRNEIMAGNQERQKPQPVKVEKKVGRNEPCPCGSGKKFKHCHGKVGVQA